MANRSQYLTQQELEECVENMSDVSEKDPYDTQADSDDDDPNFIPDNIENETNETEDQIEEAEQQREDALSEIDISDDDIVFPQETDNYIANSGRVWSRK